MSTILSYPIKPVTLFLVNLIIVDDIKKNLDNFKICVDQFNTSDDYDEYTLSNQMRLNFRAHGFTSTADVVELLKEEGENYPALICDYNLANDDLGLSFITYLMKEEFGNKKRVFSLYTLGGMYNNEDILSKCKEMGIFFNPKAEVLTLLLCQIANKLISEIELEIKGVKTNFNNFSINFLQKVTTDIINDLENLRSENPDFSILAGDKEYNIDSLIHEVKTLSDFGRNYILNYYLGLKAIKD